MVIDVSTSLYVAGLLLILALLLWQGSGRIDDIDFSELDGEDYVP